MKKMPVVFLLASFFCQESILIGRRLMVPRFGSFVSFAHQVMNAGEEGLRFPVGG